MPIIQAALWEDISRSSSLRREVTDEEKPVGAHRLFVLQRTALI